MNCKRGEKIHKQLIKLDGENETKLKKEEVRNKKVCLEEEIATAAMAEEAQAEAISGVF